MCVGRDKRRRGAGGPGEKNYQGGRFKTEKPKNIKSESDSKKKADKHHAQVKTA